MNDEIISCYVQCKLKEKNKGSIFLTYSRSATKILYNRNFHFYKKTNFSKFTGLIGAISLENVH